MTVPASVIRASDGRLMFQQAIAATMAGIEPVISGPGICPEGRHKVQLVCEGEGDDGVFCADADAGREFVHILNADDEANFLLAPATDGICQSVSAPRFGVIDSCSMNI